jgi:hypothetical protein
MPCCRSCRAWSGFPRSRGQLHCRWRHRMALAAASEAESGTVCGWGAASWMMPLPLVHQLLIALMNSPLPAGHLPVPGWWLSSRVVRSVPWFPLIEGGRSVQSNRSLLRLMTSCARIASICVAVRWSCWSTNSPHASTGINRGFRAGPVGRRIAGAHQQIQTVCRAPAKQPGGECPTAGSSGPGRSIPPAAGLPRRWWWNPHARCKPGFPTAASAAVPGWTR